MAFAFEKLLVYQTSVDFADQIWARSEQFPRGYGFLVDQNNRASLSISSTPHSEFRIPHSFPSPLSTPSFLTRGILSAKLISS